MPKYKVWGTIELNWMNVVEAESEELADEKAMDMAEDGIGLGSPVESPEVNGAELL